LVLVLLFSPPLKSGEGQTGSPRGFDGPRLGQWSRPVDRSAESLSGAFSGEFPRAAAETPESATPGRAAYAVRLPGEFERQEMILLAYNDLATTYPHLFLKLAAELRARTRVVVLVDDGQAEFVDELLAEYDVQGLKLECLEVRHDTMWIRDYGPIVVQAPRGARVAVDADYVQYGRDHDDAVPSLVAATGKLDVTVAAFDLEGGNLLSNGDGLLLSTTVCLINNAGHGRDEIQVAQLFRECFGGDVLFLEPLFGEPTGHVDMFATFVSRDTIVVGEYSPDADPENAAILDRNARRLSQLKTSDGRPLRVVRIPMPDHSDGVWRTHTNVVLANGLLAVPIYPRLEHNEDERALDTFKHAAPQLRIVPIDASELIESGGGLHCVTMNVPAAASGSKDPRSPQTQSRMARRPLRILPQIPRG
jgi:agmatine/peptidylarginine deiminase